MRRERRFWWESDAAWRRISVGGDAARQQISVRWRRGVSADLDEEAVRQAGDDLAFFSYGAGLDADAVGAVGVGDGDGAVVDDDGIAALCCLDGDGLAAAVRRERDLAADAAVDGDDSGAERRALAHEEQRREGEEREAGEEQAVGACEDGKLVFHGCLRGMMLRAGGESAGSAFAGAASPLLEWGLCRSYGRFEDDAPQLAFAGARRK